MSKDILNPEILDTVNKDGFFEYKRIYSGFEPGHNIHQAVIDEENKLILVRKSEVDMAFGLHRFEYQQYDLNGKKHGTYACICNIGNDDFSDTGTNALSERTHENGATLPTVIAGRRDTYENNVLTSREPGVDFSFIHQMQQQISKLLEAVRLEKGVDPVAIFGDNKEPVTHKPVKPFGLFSNPFRSFKNNRLLS